MTPLLQEARKITKNSRSPVISTALDKAVNNIKKSIGKFKSKKLEKNEMAYLKTTEPCFPIIPVQDKYFLIAVDNKKFRGIVWLSDWFEIDSVYSNTNNNCFVKLKIRDNIIETSYSVFQPKNIINLSDFGIVINFDYANEMSKYMYKKLAEFDIEKQNNNLGFFEKDGKLGFNAYDNKNPVLRYTPDVTIKEYAEGLNKLLTNIPLMFALCCSCASIFLAYLNMKCDMLIDSFVISFFGKTTTGKSTAQSLMASVFSSPDDKRIFSPFYGTSNAVIKRIANKYGVPQIFDEATVTNNINMSELIYTISLENEKYRCNSGSNLQDVSVWKSIIHTSSENRLLTETCMHNKGLEVRCFSFDNLQYTDSREHSEQIQAFCHENYGVLGKNITENLLTANPEEIFNKYDDCRKILRKAIGSTAFDLSERLINKYALIMISAEVLNVIGINIKTEKILDILVDNHNEISLTSNIAKNYYDYIMSYAASNPNLSAIRIDTNIGKVVIIETLLLSILKKHGATDTKFVINELDKNGFIIRQRKNTPKSRLSFNKVLTNCYQFKMPEKFDDEVSEEIKISDCTFNLFDGVKEPW